MIQGLRNLSSCYINHIWNEDNMLFPMANKVFSEEDQQKMLEGFDRIDALRGQKLHDRLEEFALKLEEQF